jgi:eukaryotic-like serine/threonine-protein kinase
VVTEPTSSTAGRAPPSKDPKALVGTILAERYRIEELLGQGGMGTVYRAEHVHMKRAVALKVLHPEIAAVSEVAARFEREAIAVGRIEHRNVAKAMDFGRLPNGSFYLVMEYVKGTSLRELIKRGPLAPARALEIARQTAEAIEAAHDAGVVHRDLKPDNVMLADRSGLHDQVKVLDFGVAKIATDEARGDSAITQYGAIVGTLDYMAPEQAGGGVVDHRADLYALGVILYELLAGHPPFSADEPVVLISKHLVEPPPALPASITEKTAAIVFDLLAKDPNLRIQSAADLIARIEEVHAETGLGVTEPPPRAATHEDTLPVQRGQSPIAQGRRPSRALAAAVLALITMVAGAVALVAAKRSNQNPSTAPDDSANGTAVANETIGQQSPNTGTTSKSRVEIPAPETRASAVPGSATAASTPSSESEGMKATRAPEAKPARASTAAVQRSAQRSAAQKKISAPGRGKRYVVRRTIIRRTVITTSR